MGPTGGRKGGLFTVAVSGFIAYLPIGVMRSVGS